MIYQVRCWLVIFLDEGCNGATQKLDPTSVVPNHRLWAIFHLLTCERLGFLFRSDDDAKTIMKRLWFMNSLVLYLNPWQPIFDVKEELMEKMPIWVKLPSLSMKLWTDRALWVIVDLIGKTL